MRKKTALRLFVITMSLSLLTSFAQAGEYLLAAWHGANDAPFFAENGITASSNIQSGSDWRRSANSSGTETYGTFAGAVAPLGLNNDFTGSFHVPSVAAGGDLDFTITNNGTVDHELTALRFDAWQRFPDGTSASVAISILDGGGLTSGPLSYTPLTAQEVNAVHNSMAWDSRDIFLTGLADNVLAVGESVTFRFSSTTNSSSTLWFDNVAVTAIPEPGTLTLVLVALGLGLATLRKRNSH